MADYLFPNFLRDAAEYDSAARFWQGQWQDLLSRLGEISLWETPWLGTTFANGTPCRDGNPIFSAVSHSGHLGIRIIQVEPGDNPRELTFWTDQLGECEDAITELVIACVLTPQNVTYAMDLMTQWITTHEVEIRHGNRTSRLLSLGDRDEIPVGPTVAPPSVRRPAVVLA